MKKINDRGIAHLLLLVVVVVMVAIVGTYLYLKGHAEPPAAPPGQAESQMRIATQGPCKGEYEVPAAAQGLQNACSHIDPGPPGLDLNQRSNDVPGQLQQQADFDAAHQAQENSDNPYDATPTVQSDVSSQGSLANAPAVNWPCVGTGADGDRALFIYVYPTGGTNRLSSLRSGFETIARRMNGITYYSSGTGTGQHRQILFETSAPSSGTCNLSIATKSYSSSTLASYSSLRSALINSGGAKYNNRKYIVEVDQSSSNCGMGDEYMDTTSASSNANNGYSPMFAITWSSCWNYAEPHEFMHTLGAVQNGAPYSTGYGHCTDEHDVMCYADHSGVTVTVRCGNVSGSSQWSTWNMWRYDCKHDSYFNSTGNYSGVSTWLASHWNSASSSWLRKY